MLLKYFASKNQLPGLSIGGTLDENGLSNFSIYSYLNVIKTSKNK